MHRSWMPQKEMLYRQLPEDAKLLLNANELQRMMSRDVDCGRNKRKSCECATDLIYLQG
jgi:hypothetical protein